MQRTIPHRADAQISVVCIDRSLFTGVQMAPADFRHCPVKGNGNPCRAAEKLFPAQGNGRRSIGIESPAGEDRSKLFLWSGPSSSVHSRSVLCMLDQVMTGIHSCVCDKAPSALTRHSFYAFNLHVKTSIPSRETTPFHRSRRDLYLLWGSPRVPSGRNAGQQRSHSWLFHSHGDRNSPHR